MDWVRATICAVSGSTIKNEVEVVNSGDTVLDSIFVDALDHCSGVVAPGAAEQDHEVLVGTVSGV